MRENDTVSREQASVFGIRFEIGTMKDALDDIDIMVAKEGGKPALCCFVNAHCLNIGYKNREYAALLNRSARVWADGIGAAIGARHDGKKVKENVNGTDMLPLLCKSGHSIYLLGGRPGVAQMAMDKLKADFNANIAGCWDGYFGNAPSKPLADIADKRPDIVLVAMGVPKQEFWMWDVRDKLACKVCIGVGGLLDFASGRIPRAPMWMRKARLEWVYRLYREPTRLFKRYVIGNPLFIWRILTDDKKKWEKC